MRWSRSSSSLWVKSSSFLVRLSSFFLVRSFSFKNKCYVVNSQDKKLSKIGPCTVDIFAVQASPLSVFIKQNVALPIFGVANHQEFNGAISSLTTLCDKLHRSDLGII